jgi:hypothetical protein
MSVREAEEAEKRQRLHDKEEEAAHLDDRKKNK